MKIARSQMREVLAVLSRADLGFHGVDSGYGPHRLHAFAAKFPPQLPRLFIEALTLKDQVVLDPMAGSGTAIVEALAAGRKAIAIDIDPLAVLITKVKCSYLDPALARASVERAATRAQFMWDTASLAKTLESRFVQQTLEFLNYWFAPQTQVKLMALLLAIEEEPDSNLKDFLKAVFSSTIVTKSGGVSLARDLAHSRPHRDATKAPRDPIGEFAKRGLKAAEGLAFWNTDPGSRAVVCQADARALPLQRESVDLIITSPPYANAIDYVRAHKFSLVWMGYSIPSLTAHRGKYIGAEKPPDGKANLPLAVNQVVNFVRERDPRKGEILARYFYDMRFAVKEMKRVLRPGSVAMIVVGPSLIRSILVKTHECLAELMASEGFSVLDIAERALDRDKRLMPASATLSNLNGIEKRIHREFVVAGVKE